MVVFETVRLPVVGGAVQLMSNVVLTVPPVGTVTVCGFAPATLQFSATPESATL